MVDDNQYKTVVVIGGGTGTSVILRGLKKYNLSLGAIISTSDSGGSSGLLREEIDMVPPGDIRQCFVTLNEGNNKFLELFNTRFSKGSLKGHAFGNLFFALLAQNDKDFSNVMSQAESIVDSEYHIVPVTKNKTDIVAYLKDGTIIENQYDLKIAQDVQPRLERLEVLPKNIELNEEVESVLRYADMIVIGPGDAVSSISPPLLVGGMVDLINKSKAKKVFVSNLFNIPNVSGFSVYDYLMYFEKYVGKIEFDVVVYNNCKIQKSRLDSLDILENELVVIGKELEGLQYLGGDVVSNEHTLVVEGDPINRTSLRHDSDKIAKILYELVAQ